mgnify:CR=1 FL=1
MKKQKKLLDNASREAETLKKETIVQTREEIHKLREDVEQENKQRRDELQKSNSVLCRRKIIWTGEAATWNSRESQLDKKEKPGKVQKES